MTKMYRCARLVWPLALMALLAAAPAGAQGPPKPGWADAVKDARPLEGLFNLWFSPAEQHLLLALTKADLGVELLATVTVARGRLGWSGPGEPVAASVITFRRSGPQIQVIRRNVEHRADPDTPEAGAVVTGFVDNVIAALRIRAEEGDRVLVDLGDLLYSGVLISDGRLPIDPTRSSYESLKDLPANLQVRLSLNVANQQVELMFGFLKLPRDGSYAPRGGDDRVGYFEDFLDNFSSPTEDTAVRLVYRWKLEKAEPEAALSDPKEPIIWWIEKTVPREYRSYVREGILEWNKAFEKIGFRNAIEVRQQTDDDDFDPADIRYTTFRWAADPAAYAIGPSITNPKTGQILGAEVIFHENMIRYEKAEWLARKGLPDAAQLRRGGQRLWLRRHAGLVPFLDLQAPPPTAADEPAPAGGHDRCELQSADLQRQFQLASEFYNVRQGRPPAAKVPVEFIGQFVKYIAMHEVGHCLGLRHNFRASGALRGQDLHNKELTAKQGLSASVMDYLPANIALPGEPQGYYWTPTLGAYDYWAIEYGYKPVDAKGLKAIAQRTAEPGLAYGTDEDMFRGVDPRVGVWDLGDPADYSRYQVKLLTQGLPGLAERSVADGESWERASTAFGMLIYQYASGALRMADLPGSWYLARHHRGDPHADDPVTPLPPERVREAVKFLDDTVFAAGAVKFEPALLRKLGPSNWSDSFSLQVGANVDRLQANIRLACIARLLSAWTLRELEAQAAYLPPDAPPAARPVTAAELFGAVTHTVFAELPPPGVAAKPIALTPTQRIVQQDLTGRLARLVTGGQARISLLELLMGGGTTPADAKVAARAQLRQLQAALTQVLEQGATLDGVSRTHYESLRDTVAAALTAQAAIALN